MYLSIPDIHAAATACEAAGRSIGDSLEAGALIDEDDVTSVLLDRIRGRLDGLSISGFRWQARKTSSRYENSEENRSGADLLGVLQVVVPNEITLRKGFLAQAKLFNRGGGMARLRKQCDQMLAVTPDSFVFFYDKSGVRVVPALLFAEGRLGRKHVEPWSLEKFFEAHFSCFIGDPRLAATSRAEFEDMLPDAPIPKEILVVTATPAGSVHV